MADVHEIEWYGPARGPKSVESIVSHMPGTREAIAGKALGMGREAAALLSVHHRKGNAHIEVEGAPPRKLDWYVYLKDADPGGKSHRGKAKNIPDRSAMSIEFGHVAKGGRHVEGLHILGQVMQRAARRYRG